MSYRKVGGLHFVRLGRFGFSFFVSRRKTSKKSPKVPFGIPTRNSGRLRGE